jgi:hypothetical protein
MKMINHVRIRAVAQQGPNAALGSAICSNGQVRGQMLREAVTRPPIHGICAVDVKVVGKEEHQGIGIVALEAAENVHRGDHVQK